MTDIDDHADPLDSVVRALQAPPRADELEGEAAMVDAMVAAAVAPQEIITMPSRSRPLKVAVLAGAAVLSLAGVAAAATALPESKPASRPPATTAVASSSMPATTVEPGPTSTTDPSSGTTAATTAEPTTVPTTTATSVDGATGGDVAAPPCPPDVANHGEYVSKVARETPPGPDHGRIVSAAARSDCGKPGATTGDEDGDEVTTTTAVAAERGRPAPVPGRPGPPVTAGNGSKQGNGANGNGGNGNANGGGNGHGRGGG